MSLLLLLLLFGGIYGNTQTQTEKQITISTPTPTCSPSVTPTPQYEKVSWYGREYCDQHSPACITASGESFQDTDFTAACDVRYPLGSYLRVDYRGKSVVIRCNDRGDFKKYGRTLDLSKAAFASLADLSKGVIQVQITKIDGNVH